MKLYTRGGDDGTTGLAGNQRVQKCDARIVAIGSVDETNAAIGVAAAHCSNDDLLAILRAIQSDLFVLGAQLAGAQAGRRAVCIRDAQVYQLENWIDQACAATPPLANFVLPGGVETAADLHLARVLCRRAERETVRLAEDAAVDGVVLTYLNRLSDLLFALARQANHRAGVADIPWTAPKV